jgi:two-component system OmpR family sensor kinase
MSRLPIRLRLALAFALVMGIVLAAMGAFVFVRVERSLTATVNRDLKAQLEEIRTHAEAGARPSEPLVDPETHVLSQFLDAKGQLVSSGGLALRPLLSAADAQRVIAGARIEHDGDARGLAGDWRLVAAPRTFGDRRVAVVVAASLRERNDTLAHLFVQLLIAGVAGIALAVLVGYWLAARALRPVEAMRREAEEISSVTSATRLPVPRPHDEIRRLGETLNAMLDRIGDAVDHERRFVADVSHELRTPLSLLKAELELAHSRPRSREDLRAAVRSASAETDRLVRITEDLLLIARSDQAELPLRLETIDPAEVAEAVAARFRTRVEGERREVRVDVARGLAVEADRLRLEQALGNLVDNALVHGSGEIVVSVVSRSDWLEFHVVDEGAGFDSDFAERAFDRFSRSDESRSGGGTGLGLAIVDVLARAHGGSVGASRHVADVWIRLPMTPQHELADA